MWRHYTPIHSIPPPTYPALIAFTNLESGNTEGGTTAWLSQCYLVIGEKGLTAELCLIGTAGNKYANRKIIHVEASEVIKKKKKKVSKDSFASTSKTKADKQTEAQLR